TSENGDEEGRRRRQRPAPRLSTKREGIGYARIAVRRVHLDVANVSRSRWDTVNEGVPLADGDAADDLPVPLGDGDVPPFSLEPVQREEIRPAIHAQADLAVHRAGSGERDQLLIVGRR